MQNHDAAVFNTINEIVEVRDVDCELFKDPFNH